MSALEKQIYAVDMQSHDKPRTYRVPVIAVDVAEAMTVAEERWKESKRNERVTIVEVTVIGPWVISEVDDE